MCGNKTTVSVQVSEDRKSRWEEESGELSMSQFIRTAVGAFINRENQENEALSPELEEKMETLLDQNASIKTELRELSNQSQIIYQEVRKTPESTQELAGEIFEILPTREQLLGQTQKSLTSSNQDEIFYDGYIRTGRIDHIANHLDENPTQVQNALRVLDEEYQMAEKVQTEGHPRYFKDD